MMYVVPVVIIFIALVLLIYSLYGLVLGSRQQISRRLKEIDRLSVVEEFLENNTNADIEEETSGYKPEIERHERKKISLLDNYYKRTARKLQKARLLYRPQEFLILSLAAALLVVLVLFFMINAIDPFSRLVLILLGGTAGFMIPNIYLTFRERKFRNLLSRQLGDMLLLLSNYLRAGHSIVKGIELVSREVAPPLSDELKKTVKDINMGGTVPSALKDLEKRTGDEDLGLMITAILIHHQVGGNLSEVLDKINNTIRERVRLKGEIKTLTAQGKMTGMVIGLLPVGVGLLVFFMNPSFITILFTEPLGRFMLLMAVAGEIMGVMLIRRIVQIQV